MRIVNLKAKNIKRLQAVDITPAEDSGVVVIGGNNGQGKSSVLDAIAYALGGKRLVGPVPVRQGEQKAKVEVQTDGGLRIVRTFTAAGGGAVTVYQGEAKVGSPQGVLDALSSEFTFDPTAFVQLKPAQQRDMLLQLLGVDFADLETEEQELRTTRALINREIKQLQAVTATHMDHPQAQPVDITELSERIQQAQQIIRQRERWQQEQDGIANRLLALKRSVHEMKRSIQELEQQYDALNDQIAAQETLADDPDDLMQQLRNAEGINQQHARFQENLVKVQALTTKQEEAADLTEKIQSIPALKQERIATAHCAVPGIGLTDEGLTYKGMPLEQCSSAEVLRLSVALGIAANPDLRIMLLRNGAYLDTKSMQILQFLAKKHDMQLWIERVGDGDAAAIVIEDGTVRP